MRKTVVLVISSLMILASHAMAMGKLDSSSHLEPTALQPLFYYDKEGEFAIPIFRQEFFPLSLWRINERSYKPEMVFDAAENVSFVALSDDNASLITAVDATISLWMREQHILKKVFSLTTLSPVASLALNKNGKRLVVEDMRGDFFVYGVSVNGIELIAKQEPKLGFSTVFLTKKQSIRLAVHPQGNAFAVGDHDGRITTYLVANDKIINLAPMQAFEKSRINGMMFTSNDILVAQTIHGAIDAWTFAHGILVDIHVLRAGSQEETKPYTPVRFSISKDGKKLISRDRDGTLLLWSLSATGWSLAKELCHPQLPGSAYQDAFFSHGIPVLWSDQEDLAWVLTKFN